MLTDTIHATLLAETKKRTRTEHYLFSEELYKVKILPFKENITEVLDKRFVQKSLLTTTIIVYEPKPKWKIKYINCKYLEPVGELYIRLDDFNTHWKSMRDSVSYGIWRNKSYCNELGISRPEDIVRLKHLNSRTQDAYLHHNMISFRLNDESKKMLSIRQSKMDNKQAIYAFSTKCMVVHDKACETLSNIPDGDLDVSEEVPEGYSFCSKCFRTLLIRRGCFPNTKEIPICTRFFADNLVATSTIQKMIEQGESFHADSLNELRIQGQEDSWILRVDDDGHTLFHNNYVKLSDTERYIVSGYHNQNLSGYSVGAMLKYTALYSWEKHLEQQYINELQELQNEDCAIVDVGDDF